MLFLEPEIIEHDNIEFLIYIKELTIQEIKELKKESQAISEGEVEVFNPSLLIIKTIYDYQTKTPLFETIEEVERLDVELFSKIKRATLDINVINQKKGLALKEKMKKDELLLSVYFLASKLKMSPREVTSKFSHKEIVNMFNFYEIKSEIEKSKR